MKFDQLTEYNIRNIFLRKSYTKCGGEAIPRPSWKKSFSNVLSKCKVDWKACKVNNIEKWPTKIEEGSLKKKNFAKLLNAGRRWQIISGNCVLTTLSYFLLEVNDRNQIKEMIHFTIMVLAFKLPMMKKIIQACKSFSVLFCC